MPIDIAAAMGREHKLEADDSPKMIVEDALANGLKYTSFRDKKRTETRLMKQFETELNQQTASFFVRINKCNDVELQAGHLLILDGQWKAWLRQNITKYNYENCKDFFATRLSYLMAERRKATELLLKKLEKKEPGNKV